LHEGLPFRILGLDSDSGSEFLNALPVEYCAALLVTSLDAGHRTGPGLLCSDPGNPHEPLRKRNGLAERDEMPAR
jgi:hypothetical protein